MNNRSNLKNYYKKVYTCILCRKRYGSDYVRENNVCPICEIKMREKEKKKRRREIEKIEKFK